MQRTAYTIAQIETALDEGWELCLETAALVRVKKDWMGQPQRFVIGLTLDSVDAYVDA